MTCLAFFDISHDAGFARMRAVNDFAFRAVLQFSMGFHQEPPESPALYSEISAANFMACPYLFSTDAFSRLPSNPTEAVSGPRPTPHDYLAWCSSVRSLPPVQGDRFVARSLRWYRRLWQPANQLRRCVTAENVSTALVTGEDSPPIALAFYFTVAVSLTPSTVSTPAGDKDSIVPDTTTSEICMR